MELMLEVGVAGRRLSCRKGYLAKVVAQLEQEGKLV